MSASEASRSFSAVLSAAERGETVVVTRAGRPVALIGPAPSANGAAVRGVLRRWRDSPMIDERFAAQVAAASGGVSGELDRDPWRA